MGSVMSEKTGFEAGFSGDEQIRTPVADSRSHHDYSCATVHRLDYRILDREGGLVQRFRVWTELPSGQASEGSVPVFPVAFEFKAESFLRLHAVRVTDTASE